VVKTSSMTVSLDCVPSARTSAASSPVSSAISTVPVHRSIFIHALIFYYELLATCSLCSLYFVLIAA